jgi:hypothetical protein
MKVIYTQIYVNRRGTLVSKYKIVCFVLFLARLFEEKKLSYCRHLGLIVLAIVYKYLKQQVLISIHYFYALKI